MNYGVQQAQTRPAAVNGLGPEERQLLAKIEDGLWLLADLCKADVVIYCPGSQPNTAVAVAHASPHTVSPVYPASMVGKQVGKKSDPAIFHVLERGLLPRPPHAVTARGISTVVDIQPVKLGDRLLAAACFEMNVLEYDRMRKRSAVFRKALAHLQQVVLSGRLRGVGSLTPLGEHDGFLVVDAGGAIRYISGIAANLYRKVGYTDPLVGTSIADLETNEQVYFRALENGECREEEIQEQGLIWIKKVVPLPAEPSSWHPLHGDGAQIAGVVVIIQDITEQRHKEQEIRIKSALIQEIHHRVKNNLQTIAALLRMQARRTRSPEVAQIVQDSVNRILSIAVVHEFLSLDVDSFVNVRDVAQQIIREVTQGILAPDKRIAFELLGSSVYLPAQKATSCALVINELLQNAVEHGFGTRDEGKITVQLEDTGDELTIEISDNGTGLPPGFNLFQGGSLGLQIVNTLVTEDLKGQFELVGGGEGGQGVQARVTVPKESVGTS